MRLSAVQERAAATKGRYLETERDWERAAQRLWEGTRRGSLPVGLDTEFYGLDIRKESCAARSIVHVWSMAVLTDKIGPRGHRRGIGVTLPVHALGHPAIRQLLEDEGVKKAVHNLPVDAHSLYNHGVTLRGGINTLSLARWVWPGRAGTGEGFGLKGLMVDVLGRNPLGDFKELFCEENLVERIREKKLKRCECGAQPCRSRSTTEGHRRLEVVERKVIHTIPKAKPTKPVPLEGIVPGHPLWKVLVPYAAEDAEAAVELWDSAQRKGRQTYVEVPW